METICAIATPAGGALGIIRVSGPEAINATSKIFIPAGQRALTEKKGGTLSFGRIIAPQTGELIDEAVASIFRAPHSYTGEDCVELSCHGSQYILTRVMELLLEEGCRLAQPGEYTQRAFLNGKMDLSQAEGVADLIASTTSANHRMAMQQMRGGFSNELRQLRDQLLHITSLLELELDFSDHEDLEFASRTELQKLAQKIHDHIASLCQSFRVGNALKKGLPVAIVGETNAGKSTLLNTLVGEDRALVSNIHGTTRDTIEETVVIGDTLVRFIDTAGIRQTRDTVERMGIDRTFEKIAEAEIILWIIDITQVDEQFATLADRIFKECKDKKVVILLNKKDLIPPSAITTITQSFTRKLSTIASSIIVYASTGPIDTPLSNVRGEANTNPTAIKGENNTASSNAGTTENKDVTRPLTLELLSICAQEAGTKHIIENIIAQSLKSIYASNNSESGTIVNNLRHYEALTSALESIERVSLGLQTELSGDFISQDLRECIHHLSDIVGEVTTDSVLQNIFVHFCVGK